MVDDREQRIPLSTTNEFHLTPESLHSGSDNVPTNSNIAVPASFGQSNNVSTDEQQSPLLSYAPDFESTFLDSEMLFENDNTETANVPNDSSPIFTSPRGESGRTETLGLSLNRFEAYVEDTLGCYAPSFRDSQRPPRASTDQRHPTTKLPSTWQGSGYQQMREGTEHQYPLEVNMASRSTIDIEHQVVRVDSADMEYLKAKGAFDLPPRHLQEDLVEAFFADVHPTAPVINKSEFLSEFYGKGSPSRLLLFAMFTSGSRACRNPALLDNKGTNQGSAQRFYRATKVEFFCQPCREIL